MTTFLNSALMRQLGQPMQTRTSFGKWNSSRRASNGSQRLSATITVRSSNASLAPDELRRWLGSTQVRETHRSKSGSTFEAMWDELGDAATDQARKNPRGPYWHGRNVRDYSDSPKRNRTLRDARLASSIGR